MLRIACFIPENSGVGLYRFHQPLKDLEERAIIELRSWGFDGTNKRFDPPTTKELEELASWADIVIFGRQDIPIWKKNIEIVKEIFKKPVLLDIDDNIFSISPYLSASAAYHPNGEPMKIHEEIAKYVDGIIVSTPRLAEIYKKYNKVWVVPNGIKYILDKKPHDGVNIGYLVSASHLENAQIIEAAVIRILMKYSNVKFFYTKAFQGFMDSVPEQIKPQVNYLPFFPLNDYLKYVNNLNLDIGLAPLMDNEFNRCKSNIRVLEYWQNKSAVIASPLDEYTKTITDGFDGYFSRDDEWFEKIENLICNPEIRKYLIKNSQDTIKNYDVSKFADKYLEVLREITHG